MSFTTSNRWPRIKEHSTSPSPPASKTQRSLQLIADSLGMSVASFYEDAASRSEDARSEEGAALNLSRDSAVLLDSFMGLTDPADRELCIAFVQKIAAGKEGSGS